MRLSFRSFSLFAIISAAIVASEEDKIEVTARYLKDIDDEDFDCSDLPTILKEGSLEDNLPHASEYFRSEFDADDFLSNFIFADDDDIPRKKLCKRIAKGPAYNVMSCLAQEAGTTIGLDFGTDFSLFGFKIEYVVSLLWGEDGQFACAYNEGLGGALDLLGVGSSFGVSIRSISNGGWDTVAATEETRLCLTAGYTVLVGLAATLTIEPTTLNLVDAINMIENALEVKTWDHDTENQMEVFQSTLHNLSDLSDVDGVISVGIEANAGFEFLDMTVVGALIPDISVTFCTEKLTYCVGEGCKEKFMA